MPELTAIISDDMKKKYLSDILNTVVLKDIITRYQIRDVDYLMKVMRYLADVIGSPVSLRNIQNASKVFGRGEHSINQVGKYADMLQIPYLIHKVERFDILGKKLLERNEKYYFNDIGLRNSLKLAMETDKGKLIENLVYLHLLKLGYTVRIGNLGEKEIDFMIQKGENRAYIQVAYLLGEGDTREREFRNLLDIPDAFPKYVVSAEQLASDYLGIKHWYITDFLQKFEG
jgi:predicted AAA+ superfamily ATPase